MCAAGADLGPPDEIDHILSAMDQALYHRGPDDRGLHVERRVALGMRRLSIIDVTGGRQPFCSEDQSVWAVFNGEIYNHLALRRALQARGHVFSSGSDGEVIPHLYEEYGSRLCDELDGMFAIAVWDKKTQTLLLARDRLGIKPLYFAARPHRFSFASELKAFFDHPDVARALNPAALSHYLTFGYTPADRAILEGVEKLEPARCLVYQAGAIRRWRYWQLPAEDRTPPSLDAAVAEVRAGVVAAVRSHLRADVPVGAFLSGGIDSATVVGAMRALEVEPHTFSIGFDDPAFDELAYARVVARHVGARHEELVVRPDAWALVESLALKLDEPFADVSAIPTYLVAQMAAQKVKVVLTGDGGDELFAGYDRYPRALSDVRRLDRLPGFARGVLAAVSATLAEGAPGKRWLRHASLPPRLRYLDDQALFPADYKARLLAPDLSARLRGDDPLGAAARRLGDEPGDALSRLLRFDVQQYLPEDLLTKVDRMTMAHSLEARPPLLDHHLVETVFRLPAAFKLQGGVGKVLLRRAVADLVPASVLIREKRGFGVPIRRWFRGPLAEDVASILDDRRTHERGYFDRRFVTHLRAQHGRGRYDQSLRLWGLVMLELWCRKVLDRPAQRRVMGEEAHG
jgi:asparagine synthase (glutamine-hydrolysing)